MKSKQENDEAVRFFTKPGTLEFISRRRTKVRVVNVRDIIGFNQER